MRNIKTLADVQQVPKDEWIVLYSRGGYSPYCGKKLPSYSDCCVVRYGACDCEVAKAIKEHNDKITGK